MAKPRTPKKSNGAKDALSASSTAVTASDVTNGAADQIAAAVLSDIPPAETKVSRKSARMPEIVKSDSRPNLVPINVEEEIRQLAYLLAERRGFEPGHEAEDWLAAEREIQQRYRLQSA